MGIAHWGKVLLLGVEIEGGLKGGKRNVVDDFCGSFGFVAAGYCDQLHGWRVHSYIARAGAGGAAIQHHKWPSNGHISQNQQLFARLAPETIAECWRVRAL